MISIINATLNTERRFSCITRARRFGKSMAAKMLCAYYDQSCYSRSLFSELEIASDPSFERHLNKYPVIYLDLTAFVTRFTDDIVKQLDAELRKDVRAAYPQVLPNEGDDLMSYLIRVYQATGQQFIFIIDE